MQILLDVSLRNFNFCKGARERANYLTLEELDTIENILEGLYMGDPVPECEIDNLFWFEEDTIAEWLGYSSFDEIIERDD